MNYIKLLIILLLPCYAFSQVGTSGAYGPDYEIIEKCVDSLDLGTNYISFYDLQTIRPGQTTISAKFRSNGSSFTPPSGKVTLGMCPQSISIAKDSLRDYEVQQLCDQSAGTSTPFLRIIARVTWPTSGAGSTYIFSNINLIGGSYTPSGNILTGPCVDVVSAPNYTNSIVISASSTYSLEYESWSVSNIGFGTATISIAGGSAVDLLEGEMISCSSYIDENTKKIFKCGTFTVNATGGGYCKVTTRKN